MTEDATLSEFAASADDGETESDSDGPETDAAVDTRSETDDSSPDGEESAAGEAGPTTDGETAGTEETTSAAADPSETAAGRSTYAWGTYTCSQCDAAVDRVWRDDSGLVCPDCKSW